MNSVVGRRAFVRNMAVGLPVLAGATSIPSLAQGAAISRASLLVEAYSRSSNRPGASPDGWPAQRHAAPRPHRGRRSRGRVPSEDVGPVPPGVRPRRRGLHGIPRADCRKGCSRHQHAAAGLHSHAQRTEVLWHRRSRGSTSASPRTTHEWLPSRCSPKSASLLPMPRTRALSTR